MTYRATMPKLGMPITRHDVMNFVVLPESGKALFLGVTWLRDLVQLYVMERLMEALYTLEQGISH